MTDYFALLDQPRRPWLEVEPLKVRFLERSAEVHPDRLHQPTKEKLDAATQTYAELNAAYNCLREPKDRLQHLLLLEQGTKPGGIDSVPEDLMDAFLETGKLCREVDLFLAERARTTSPLLRVPMFERGMAWTDKLNEFQRKLDLQRTALDQILRAMNAAWETAPPIGDTNRAAHLPLGDLQHIYRTFSYLARWSGQLQERAVQLML